MRARVCVFVRTVYSASQCGVVERIEGYTVAGSGFGVCVGGGCDRAR